MVTKTKVKQTVRRAVREHLAMAERLLREGDAVKDCEGVGIEVHLSRASRCRPAALTGCAPSR